MKLVQLWAATIGISGLGADGNSPEAPADGSSKPFRIVVAGILAGDSAHVLGMPRTVPAPTSPFLTATGTDGLAGTISDPRSVRVLAR